MRAGRIENIASMAEETNATTVSNAEAGEKLKVLVTSLQGDLARIKA